MMQIFNKRMLIRIQRYIDGLVVIHKPLYISYCSYAVDGHLSLIKYYLKIDNSMICHRSVINFAAGFGHLHIVKWLHYSKRSEKCDNEAMDWAAEEGRLDIVEWLYETAHAEHSSQAILNAAADGHINVIKWFQNKGFISGKNNFNARQFAHANGHDDIDLYLLQCADKN